MTNNWNPQEEHIEGKLCEKGLMHEHFDSNKNDLVRGLTINGKIIAEKLLHDPQWMREYLLMAKEKFSKFPKETQFTLWKNLIKQLKEIKKEK